MQLTSRHLRSHLARGQDGFTMILAIMVLLIGSLLAAGALAAVTGDIHLTGADTSTKKAYYAAMAGIDAYQYQLNANPNYWITCPSTSASVKVPSTTDEEYTSKTLPATGHTTCEKEKQTTIVETSGTFRVESTGTSGGKTRSIVATFTHPGFLNYVYFTNYEVADPTTKSPVPANCEHYYKYRLEHSLTGECGPIQFAPKDKVNGPLHTNDAAAICAEGALKPTFGRTIKDKIEMGGEGTPPVGHYAAGGSCTNEPNFVGTYTTEAPTLVPPESDSELLSSAGYIFKGKTIIVLKSGSPNTMKVITGGKEETKNFPTNGVVYVEPSSSGCGISYSPFKTNYSSDTGCGNVYVSGTYTASLTIAAAGDLIINGNLTTTTEASGKPVGGATLGLIATGFVRVYHPVGTTYAEPCKFGDTNLGGGKCEYKNVVGSCDAPNLNAAEDPNKLGGSFTPVIDAAILSTHHSFIVDNFTCGASLGELTTWGAIAQFWRGPVGTGGSSSTGYVKNYNYDERLAAQQPPNFLSPSTTAWHTTRETAPPSGFG